MLIRVYASKISKEMFSGEDITLREVAPKPPLIVETFTPGKLRRIREAKDAHRKGRFAATSLALQAIFSSTENAQTRKFLRLKGSDDAKPQALSRLGKGKWQQTQGKDILVFHMIMFLLPSVCWCCGVELMRSLSVS